MNHHELNEARAQNRWSEANEARQAALTAAQVRRILAGSCTPAIDLLRMVDDGLITAHDATEALQASGRGVTDVHSAAAYERDYMRIHDI
jgi:hypothetical protein